VGSHSLADFDTGEKVLNEKYQQLVSVKAAMCYRIQGYLKYGFSI
jgi:hypothetical protein